MKHLKPFNESKEIFVEELKDFCENNLAYLIDDNEVEIELTNQEDNFVGIRIFFNNLQEFYDANKPGMKWEDLKDHIIPFLTRFKRKYELKDISDYTKRFDSVIESDTYNGFILVTVEIHNSSTANRTEFSRKVNIDDLIADKKEFNQLVIVGLYLYINY